MTFIVDSRVSHGIVVYGCLVVVCCMMLTGRGRAKLCRKAWLAARPDTNCDDDVLARARVYLRSCNVRHCSVLKLLGDSSIFSSLSIC